MSSKDYRLIARVLAAAPVGVGVRVKLARAFADALKDENPRFDRQRFLDAAMTPPP